MDNVIVKKQIDKMIEVIEETRFYDSKTALDMSFEALALSRQNDYPQAEAILLLKIGSIYRNISEYEKAIEYVMLSVPMLELYNLDYHLCTAFISFGNIFFNLSYYETAFDYYNKSIYIAARYQFYDRLSMAYNNIGEIYKMLQNYDKSLFYYKKSLDEDMKIGHKACRGFPYANIAEINYFMGNYDEALRLIQIGEAMIKQHNYALLSCEVYKIYAQIYWKQHDADMARVYFLKALEAADEKLAFDYKIGILISYHQFLAEQGQIDDAIEALTDAYALSDANRLHEKSILICQYFTEIYDKKADREAALKYYMLYIHHDKEQHKKRINQISEGIELRIKTEEFKLQSEIDSLTGISNRRKFFQFIKPEWEHSIKHGHALSLIMIDIDFFKEFNDNYGHPEGDKCLMKIADIMNGLVDKNFLLSRFGGDEFIAVLPQTSMATAEGLAELLRQAVLNEKISHQFSSISEYVTITLGVASTIPTAGMNLNDFIKQADDALYHAKKSGRNKVCRKEGSYDGNDKY